MNRSFFIAAAVVAVAGNSSASFDLQVTEIWPGNEPGNNLTEDWFEITNFGTSAFTFGVDGDLHFDDESADVADSDILTPSGFTTIEAGESVIFVDENDISGWNAVWGAGLPAGTKVGGYDGKGLGQGGDGVALFLTASGVAPIGSDLLDLWEYPDADLNGGQSYDLFIGAFSTVGNASGAYQGTGLNDEGQPAIGSPGSIPAPGAAAVLGVAGLAAARRRRA